ncbi:hypothetical protein [Streptomyces sp. NPDC085937]|uniref:hypothetical protein n=1 Tax=Streptomyces sp. NPDC085937 TaxID=3365742 RepID=UPI0037CD85E1
MLRARFLPAGGVFGVRPACQAGSTGSYGRRVSESEILGDPDDREDEALAELGTLADEPKKIDPPAFDGYIGFIWAEFLDRWLW